MAISLKQLSHKPELLAPGHRACAGCTAPSVYRMILRVAGPDTVCSNATGCMEVVTSIYPFTAWRVPFIHTAFENSAATMSGVEAAYNSLKKQGKVTKDLNFIAFGGDGGTYDIGFQSLSGAMERGHNMLYVCYDNEGYMNTGIQRSSSTPKGASTSTTPDGAMVPGKQQNRKDLTACIVAHNIPYVAQASVHNHMDLMKKVEKALSTKGAAFLNVLAPCHRGWRIPGDAGVEYAKLATDTCFWPLFEVENGKWTINYTPKTKLPLNDWLKGQGRFKHLFNEKNKAILDELQQNVDRRWDEINKLVGL